MLTINLKLQISIFCRISLIERRTDYSGNSAFMVKRALQSCGVHTFR